MHSAERQAAIRQMYKLLYRSSLPLAVELHHVGHDRRASDGSTLREDASQPAADLLPAGLLLLRREVGLLIAAAAVGAAASMNGGKLIPPTFLTRTEAEADALTVLMHRLAMPADRRKPELAAAAERRLAAPFRVIENHLAQQAAAGQPYLAAARFTVADLCVASVLNWARPAKALMDANPVTHEWLRRCMARPAYLAVRENG